MPARTLKLRGGGGGDEEQSPAELMAELLVEQMAVVRLRPWYCSGVCQRDHWRQTHRYECARGRRAARRAAEDQTPVTVPQAPQNAPVMPTPKPGVETECPKPGQEEGGGGVKVLLVVP